MITMVLHGGGGKALITSVVGGFVLGSDWLHCTTAQLMYLTNVQRLALGLEGTPDAPQSVVAAAVAATGYKGYVAPDYKAAAPSSSGSGSGGSSGGGSKP